MRVESMMAFVRASASMSLQSLLFPALSEGKRSSGEASVSSLLEIEATMLGDRGGGEWGRSTLQRREEVGT
jgi:hypothetical protein